LLPYFINTVNLVHPLMYHHIHVCLFRWLRGII